MGNRLLNIRNRHMLIVRTAHDMAMSLAAGLADLSHRTIEQLRADAGP
ncbi:MULTISPECIES: hypothetical protein [unclassified Mesorhizobium]|nr:MULTISPECIES: hypothetical protein [unclassified Mesorhizobium]